MSAAANAESAPPPHSQSQVKSCPVVRDKHL